MTTQQSAGLFIWKAMFIACLNLSFVNTQASEQSYSPYAQDHFPNNLYWGDTHVHTRNSNDSVLFGYNEGLTPADAYEFARGEVVRANGMDVKLSRPLDFLVVADHAINMGVVSMTEAGGEMLKAWKLAMAKGDREVVGAFGSKIWNEDLNPSADFKATVWQSVTADAERYNAPGKFTAFIGYEWTSWGVQPGGQLHRVVIFKDGAEKTNKIVPFTSYDSKKPEALWQFFSQYEEQTGGEVLAIPHNPNLSQGQAFSLLDTDDRPLSRDYAKTRSRWEPLLEVTQIKGDSETHPDLSPNDSFAEFETWSAFRKMSEEEASNNRPHEYARSALKLGLDQQFRLGVNPFKFGLIGSTDSHTSLATADEDNFWGKFTKNGPVPKRVTGERDTLEFWGTQNSAAGYAAVWATENTRDSLFAAMKRKEVYASTGPRINVRFFGGWDYTADDALHHNLAQIGYRKGVPMGGDLTSGPRDRAPSFLIRALKDPNGANLDRVQVVKGWRDEGGNLHEKIYNVALSDQRKPDNKGKVEPVGNTVDIQSATYRNSIGEPELSVTWQDPDFDRNELAFYYVRVIEIPTPRWPAYDVKFFGIKDIPDDVLMITQDRAYTSPIWYSP